MKTIDEQIASVKRELAMRKRCYPLWVSQGRMKLDQSEHEIECMQAVLDGLLMTKAHCGEGENG